MGIVNFGIPLDETQHLQAKMNLNVAVEGGTYRGGTAKLLSGLFDKVYTIEKSDQMLQEAKQNLAACKNVVLLNGDTRSNLPQILKSEDGILFWLDAHWSGGHTYGVNDECPLIEELELIFSSGIKTFAIMVDDARLFMAPPPSPHAHEAWPSVADISAVLPDGWDLIIWSDVIFITPSDVDFRTYMQERATAEWIRWGQMNSPSLKNCLAGFVRFLLRK